MLAIIAILFLLVLIRVGNIDHTFAAKRTSYDDPEVASQVTRGAILDRNGRILAIENTYTSCSFRLDAITDLPAAAAFAAPYLDMKSSEIIEACKGHTYQAMVKRRIDKKKEEAFRAAIQAQKYTGKIKLETFTGRDYPYTFHAAQLLGFIGQDGTGLAGLEHSLDSQLSPLPGLDEKVTRGTDVTLTLDMDIQYLSDLEVQKIGNKFKPESALAIVMDAKTGDLLAVTSYPWFDPNDISDSTDDERQEKAFSMLYEPGSVFKVFSFSAIMDIGEADLATPFECTGSYTFTNRGQTATVNCVHAHGTVTPTTMIAKSCNGAISCWALQTDDRPFYDKLCSFGFNAKQDLPVTGIARSRIADPSTWSFRSKPTISFGQEMDTTALNIVSAATALANGGYLLSPHLILEKQAGDLYPGKGKILETRQVQKSKEPIISKKTADFVLGAMVEATKEGGTAIACAVDGLKVAAKTGTAQLFNEKTHSYINSRTMASTLAIVPEDDPKYIIYIAAKAPSQGSIWGSNIAAPAVGNLIRGLVAQGKLLR